MKMSRPVAKKTHRGFDRIARFYPLLENLVYGKQLSKGRQYFLKELSALQHILLLGEGNGRFLQALLEANKACEITVVEISPRMIESAIDRLSPAQRQRVKWQEDSSLTVRLPADGFDAVVTHYLFDLFDRPQQLQLLHTGMSALRSGGLWQNTEFLSDAPTAFSRLRNRLMLKINYNVLGALCDFPARNLSDADTLFSEHNFTLLEEKVFRNHFSARLWRCP